jgi:hypothetical protein
MKTHSVAFSKAKYLSYFKCNKNTYESQIATLCGPNVQLPILKPVWQVHLPFEMALTVLCLYENKWEAKYFCLQASVERLRFHARELYKRILTTESKCSILNTCVFLAFHVFVISVSCI